MDITLGQFQKLTPYRLSRVLQLVRDITNGNSFVSAYLFNWDWQVKDNGTNVTVSMRAVSPTENCSCGKRSDCIKSGGIYSSYIYQQIFVVPGFYVGCSTIETLFRSTFERLYNQTCVDYLREKSIDNIIYFNSSDTITAMNPRSPTRFLLNISIINLFNELFIEQWKINVSYAKFYEQCAPAYCTYIIEKRHDFLFIFTTILSTYGGLTVALRFLSLYTTRIILKIRQL